jgi:hypothetical protein
MQASRAILDTWWLILGTSRGGKRNGNRWEPSTSSGREGQERCSAIGKIYGSGVGREKKTKEVKYHATGIDKSRTWVGV